MSLSDWAVADVSVNWVNNEFQTCHAFRVFHVTTSNSCVQLPTKELRDIFCVMRQNKHCLLLRGKMLGIPTQCHSNIWWRWLENSFQSIPFCLTTGIITEILKAASNFWLAPGHNLTLTPAPDGILRRLHTESGYDLRSGLWPTAVFPHAARTPSTTTPAIRLT